MKAGKCDLCFHYRKLGGYMDNAGRTLEICRQCFNDKITRPRLDMVASEYAAGQEWGRACMQVLFAAVVVSLVYIVVILLWSKW